MTSKQSLTKEYSMPLKKMSDTRITRVIIKEKQFTPNERLLDQSIKLLRSMLKNDSESNISNWLKKENVKSFIKSRQDKKYYFEVSLANRKSSFRSVTNFKTKREAKRVAMRTVLRCHNRIEFRDEESGESLKFNPNQVIVEDLVGDLRKKSL